MIYNFSRDSTIFTALARENYETRTRSAIVKLKSRALAIFFTVGGAL